MAINKDYLEYLSETCEPVYKDATYNYIKPKIEEAICKISKEHSDVCLKNTSIYLQGAYVNDTFVLDDTRLEVVVEISRTSKQIDLELARLKPSLKRPDDEMRNVYTLPEFKNDLCQQLIYQTKNESIIKANKTIQVPKSIKNSLIIDILPAYKAAEYPKGSNLLIYNSYQNKYLISYPENHIKNINEKDKETNGMLKKVMRVTRRLKNILVNNQVIDFAFAPGYFTDCLMYNVPNELFKGTLYDVFLKIINYLKNSNLAHYMCAHEKFQMFNNGIDGWDYSKARKFIDLLIYCWRNLIIE